MSGDDKWEHGQQVDTFNNEVRKESEKQLPDPEKLIEKGIQTEKTFDHERMRKPLVLEPEPTPNDPAGWQTATRKAHENHVRQVEDRREEFRKAFENDRTNFNDHSSSRDDFD